MASLGKLYHLMVVLLCTTAVFSAWDDIKSKARIQSFPEPFQQKPPKSPAYMVDNTDNKNGVAPINGKAPHAGDGYVFYRDVVRDYGADNTGATNTEEAINAAIIDGDRCGEECGNTFVKGAVIYFPFIGDPHDRPIIKGCDEFTGIAMVDVDPYVPNQAQPDGTPDLRYINQNQFFRGIRNMVFDLTEMPSATDEHGQKLVPTGIHWQVSQACSLHNLYFKMPTAAAAGDKLTHVGIFTENGSGGFVSDLEFEGGAIGWRVGSQQYTATSLKFTNCVTAVQMVWDWGFNWHKIEINGGTIAFNISGRGGIDGQGIGSVSIIDSTITGVPVGILTNAHETQAPNIVIDNTAFNNVGTIVQADNGETLLSGGSQVIDLWAHGRRYSGGEGKRASGVVDVRPEKPAVLLDGAGNLFTRLRPQYEDLPASSFLIATEHGCTNDATGDNTDCINTFLQKAAASGQVAYFPGGIYTIKGTVTFPVGSKIMGTGWSQIQATGSYFQDMGNPKVAVRVGSEGDVGTMEIVDMLFTVKGNTAGAIMMEWNIHESYQGSAALWDSHIRVGGGIGTDLDVANCPKFGYNEACISVSMLLHVTNLGSGYFENFWAWIADHDNDMSLYWEIDSSASQISLYGARGVLIESQGPVWMYGSGSEHAIFYQYQIYNAKNVYLGHIQTESPYFQPNPVSPKPFDSALGLFDSDPDWAACTTDSCREAWGLRVIDSEGIIIHSAGLYSWFIDYTQDCLVSEDCQERIMQVSGSKDVAIYNIFAKGVREIASGEGYTIDQDVNQQGYTSQVSVWFPVDGDGDKNVVYIGTELYATPTAACHKPCVLVLAPSPLSSTTTIVIDPYTTSLQVGQTTTTITVIPKPVITDKIPFSNVNVTGHGTGSIIFETKTSLVLEKVTVTLTYTNGGQTTTTQRELQLPPWPQITNGPPQKWNSSDGGSITDGVTRTSSTSSRTRSIITSLEPWPEEEPTPTTSDPPAITSTKFQGCPAVEGDGKHVSVRVRCDELWFFNFCINIDGFVVTGWSFKLPKGIIGPGPPPFVPKLPNWHINLPPPIPPWPVITIGPLGISFPEKDPSCDDNKVSVPVELYTRSYGLSVSNGVTVTTTTRTITETAYDTGCPTPEWTQTAACSIQTKRAVVPPVEPTPTQAAAGNRAPRERLAARNPLLRARNEDEWQHDWDCVGETSDTVIYLEEDHDLEDELDLQRRLDFDNENFGQAYEIFSHPDLGIIFVHVWGMPESLHRKISLMPGTMLAPENRRAGTENENQDLQTRELTRHSGAWWRSQLSSYPGEAWSYEGEDTEDDMLLKYNYYHNARLGDGQIIYLFEDGIDSSDPEFADRDIYYLEGRRDIGQTSKPDIDHGNKMGKLIVGATVGIVPKATMVAFKDTPFLDTLELTLIGLIQIIESAGYKENEDDIPFAKGRCVINMSWSLIITQDDRNVLFGRELLKLLRYLDEELQCVLVTSAANKEKIASNSHYPQYFQYNGDLFDLIVVGATGKEAHRWRKSSIWRDERGNSEGDREIFYAPGMRLEVPSQRGYIKLESGSSASSALVAGLTAYFRALPSRWATDLESTKNVYHMVQHLSRKVNVVREFEADTPGLLDPDELLGQHPRIVWNGQVEDENCLLEYHSEKAQEICGLYMKGIPDDLDMWDPVTVPDACDISETSDQHLAGRSLTCEAPGGSGDGSGGEDSGVFTWTEGAPSPTCTAGCGTLCRGYYCVPKPNGMPPDYGDPATQTTPSSPTTSTRGTGVPTTRGPITTADSEPTNFPTLTGVPITGGTVPYSGEGCSTYTKSTICNGSGGRDACVTYNLCVPTKPCPPAFTVPLAPECTDSEFPYCAITSVFTRCARPMPTATDNALPLQLRNAPLIEPPTQTAHLLPPSGFATLPSPSPNPKTRVQKDGEEESKQPAPVSLSAQSLSLVPSPDLRHLEARQNGCGGSANGGCDYIPFCQTCAKIVQVPCLQASMDIYAGGASGIDITMTVREDGALACEGKFNCKYWSLKECNKVQRFTCGGGSMAVKFNFIDYVSEKYGARFPIWLDVSENDHDYDLEFCWQKVLGRTLPAACYHTVYNYRDPMCDIKGMKRDLPELSMNTTLAL
ncbi:pectin lyase-like protein [Colletotrichum eremochloae]|nr:pectin lyase-like protein [Colletotrichum eremochloae]